MTTTELLSPLSVLSFVRLSLYQRLLSFSFSQNILHRRRFSVDFLSGKIKSQDDLPQYERTTVLPDNVCSVVATSLPHH